jgi:pyruvate kinase
MPLVQKRAIALARQAAKPVIVATQMLESMVAAPRPTRAEAALLDIGRCDKGDLVVIVAGSPPGTPGRPNALRVHRIGDAIAT